MFILGDMIEHAFADLGVFLVMAHEGFYHKVRCITGQQDGLVCYIPVDSGFYIKVGNVFERR